VGLALLVVLDTLNAAKWVAFVLRDAFAASFEDIGSIVDRSPGRRKSRELHRAKPEAKSQ
jgi:DNA-directed RNA polymerase specialized sigma24 family protein